MSKGKHVAVWVLTGLLAVAFLMSGGLKLADRTTSARMFEHWGYPGWFSQVVGIAEFVSALLLLVPRTAALGALALAVTMVGAVFTHLRAGEGPQSLAPLVLLALVSVLLYLRRDELARLFGRSVTA